MDGLCGSKSLLARFEKMSQVILFFINMTNRTSAYAVWLGSGISQLKCLQYDWAWEFPDYKKFSAHNLSIDLPISNSHGPSMYTLSMDKSVTSNQATARLYITFEAN